MTRAAASSIALPPWIRLNPGGLTVEVAARPGASVSKILRADERGLTVAIAAPPERGKANDALCRHLAERLGISRSAVSIVRGETGRRKTVRIETNDPRSCAARLMESTHGNEAK